MHEGSSLFWYPGPTFCSHSVPIGHPCLSFGGNDAEQVQAAAVSSARNYPFEEIQKHALFFLLKHAFYSFWGAKYCRLEKLQKWERGREREKVRGGWIEGEKGIDIPVRGIWPTVHYIVYGDLLQAAFTDRLIPRDPSIHCSLYEDGKKCYLNLCAQPETINSWRPLQKACPCNCSWNN